MKRILNKYFIYQTKEKDFNLSKRLLNFLYINFLQEYNDLTGNRNFGN